MDIKLQADIPILHVVVIGFHHKKGCQVSIEFILKLIFYV